MLRRCVATFALVVHAFIFSTVALAQRPPVEETIETPRGLGMGTGARASVISTSAVAYNPAGLATGKLYHIESLTGYEPNAKRWTVGGAVADSISSVVGAGLSFRGVLGGDSPYRGYDARLALGVPIANVVSIGLTGRYVSMSPHHQSAENAPNNRVKGFTLDAAAKITLFKGIELAALGYNLIDRDSPLAPLMVGGSLSATFGSISIGGDALADLTTFHNATVVAGGGIELLAAGSVALRFGYRADSGRDLHSLTGSIGYVGQRLAADLALRQGVSGGNDTQLVLGMRYHVH